MIASTVETATPRLVGTSARAPTSRRVAHRTVSSRGHSAVARRSVPDEDRVTSALPRPQHVVCISFDAVVDATDEMCLVGFEAARRFWPGKIPGTPDDYADVFRMLAPCLDESSSFEAALAIRVMAEENLAERTRFRLALRRRKEERLQAEAALEAEIERAVTDKARERLEKIAVRRAKALEARRAEYRRENERMRAGRSTRPLNLREVVAGWDEIKLHASMKFGCAIETNVGWEGLTVQPAGLQAVVNEVREAFSAGDIALSADDAPRDDDDDDNDDDIGEQIEWWRADPANASAPAAAMSPKERWLASHALHHGAAEFFVTCRAEGHVAVVLGGPGRSDALCREVLSHLGVDVAPEGSARDDETWVDGACHVVGMEQGSARGLAVAALMRERETPRQRWHLVESSLAELCRVSSSSLEETTGFTRHYGSWVPAKHADKVRAELRDGVKFIDHGGLFELVGTTAPASVMDLVGGCGEE